MDTASNCDAPERGILADGRLDRWKASSCPVAQVDVSWPTLSEYASARLIV